MAPTKATTEIAVPEDTEGDLKLFINKELESALRDDAPVPTTWQELVDLNSGEIIEFQGSAWEVIDKAKLIDVPFMIADVRWYEGKFGNGVVAVMIVTEFPINGTRNKTPNYVFNDGSTGVYQQVVQMLRSSGKKSGILCSKGLRASDYEYEERDAFEDGKVTLVPARTYYVA